MLRDKIIAAARTGFAVLGVATVTWVVTLLGGWGVIVQVDETWSTVLAGAMFAIFVGVYNFVVQWLTENVWDGFGWLLGVNQAPVYVDADLRHGADHSVAVPASSGTAEAHTYEVESDSPELDLQYDEQRYPGDNYSDPHRN